MRKLKMKGYDELVPIKKKVERREKIREQKAQIAADIETVIEKELLDRLKEGIYGDLYNFNKKAFEKMLSEKEIIEEGEQEQELEDEEAEVGEEDYEFLQEDDEDEEDDEDDEDDDDDELDDEYSDEPDGEDDRRPEKKRRNE